MSNKPITILLIEDNSYDVEVIKRALDKATGATFDLVCAVRLSEGLTILARGGIACLLLDLGLPDSRGIDTFTQVYAQAKDIPIVILSGLEDESLAIETLSKGAQDYLVKGKDYLNTELLTRSIRYAIQRKKTEQDLFTERRKMEEEIQKIQKLESVGVLAGGIAHDFNNILSAILTNIQIAKMQKREDISKHLEKVEKAIYRATNLTHQLLTFAKGGAPIKKLGSVIGLLQETAIFVLHGSNVTCEFSIAGDLWPVECDKSQISQAINNFIINAREAMPEGGTVVISAKNLLVEKGKDLPVEEGKYIEISIKDEGIGIPKENIHKIFDPFFTTKHKGDGLGLASAYSIIKNHDGYIKAESKLGVGTTFNVYLPAREERIAIRGKEVEEIPCGQGRILLMDDEEIVREATGEVLKYLGYEVEFAKNGHEAIKLYKKAEESKQPFDLVIMDLTIPGGMGGKEAIGKLKEIYPGVKAIVFSGYSNDPVMADPEKYGFCGVLPKPYKIKEMGEVLHKVLTRKFNTE
ncbi:response regulator [bacterium]|nr:response regulator [bacterium]